MACVNCNKIRTALLHGKMAEAAGLTVDALREKIGFRVQEAEPEAPARGGDVAAGAPVLVGEVSSESLIPAKATKGK